MKYVTPAVNQKLLNMTCMQCSCAVANTGVVGWNCLTNGSQCQVIQNYSSSDAGLKNMSNSVFYFQKLPPESSSTAAQTTTEEPSTAISTLKMTVHTTTEKPSTMISTLKMTTSGATLHWNQTPVVIADDNPTLKNPSGIATDPITSTIFVADKDNNFVQKYLPEVTNGTTVAGNAPNTLKKPLALAWFNDTEALFITEEENDRVMRILTSNTSLNGTRVAGVGTDGSSLSELKNPSGVAVDKNGEYLYVADRDNDRILRWNLMNLTTNGTLVAGITKDSSNKNFTLNKPFGLALNQQGTALFIADRENNRIQKLALNTSVMTTAAGYADGSVTNGAYGLHHPEAIALDSLDNLYVADKENNRIQMFCNNSLNGSNILQNATLKAPSGIAIDASFNLYVSDTGNDRVLKFIPLP